MGRWTQYDEDEYRLPEGFERVGYDSDTGRYLFRGGDRSLWEGAQGAEFSEMRRVSGGSGSGVASSPVEDDDDLENGHGPARSDGYQAVATDPSSMAHPPAKSYVNINSGAYRTLFPFFLIIGCILLLVWRFVLWPTLSPEKQSCPTFRSNIDGSQHETESYYVRPGDSCWQIARDHKCDWGLFGVINGDIDCENLMPGTSLCLPVEDTEGKGTPSPTWSL